MDEGAARRREFLAQAEELLDALFADLQALRAAGTGRARRALLDRLFRHAHTLKGSAPLLDDDDAPGPRLPDAARPNQPNAPRANPVARLAHELEDLLDAARAGRAALDADALDACEDAADALSGALDAAARGETPADAPPVLVARLRQLARGESPGGTARGKSPSEAARGEPPSGAGAPARAAGAGRSSGGAGVLDRLPAEIASALGNAERARVAEAAGEGAGLVAVEVNFGLAEVDEKFNRLSAALGETCETLATLPGPPADSPERISLRLVCATREDADGLARRLAPFRAQVRALAEPNAAREPGDPAAVTPDTDAGTNDAARGETDLAARGGVDDGASGETDDAAGEPPAAGGGGEESSSPADAADTVRVPLAELDELAFAAEELYDETMAALKESAAALEGSRPRAAKKGGKAARGKPARRKGSTAPGDSADEGAAADSPTVGGAAAEGAAVGDSAVELSAVELSADENSAVESSAVESSAGRLRQKFLALSERVLALRMQTLARPLERAARAARGAARASGKQVAVEIAGGAARLDRAVAERVAGPLAHLVRNAVDHGVESPAERRAAGKESRGRVRLAAVTEGARVRVSVSDDGRGIDVERVARAARAQGIVAEGAHVSEAQALRLIFRPGFSTAGRVSETSGRGVGLDAVEHEIERAGGEVRVRTRLGRGTTFELHLPLALALVPAVLVRARGQTYALDAARVAETGRLDPAALSDGAGGARASALWRGRRLPFARLDALLGPPGDSAAGESSGGEYVSDLRGGGEGAGGSSVGAGESAGGAGDARAGVRVVVLRAASDDESAAADAGAFVVEVDEVVGRRDALVRSLGRHATRWRGTSGAIDLRDGTAALMLDLSRLLEMMGDE